MGTFRLFSGGKIPGSLDLRLQGWRLAEPNTEEDCVAIIDATALDSSAWMQVMLTKPEARRLMLVGNVSSATLRANLLSEGFGDAVADSTCLVELSARAHRLARLGQWLPRRRVVAQQLVLDLVTRNAAYETVSLGLLPREFDILWRLADSPNEIVTKQMLTQDVWQLRFMPESNSIAVHISRLKRKLGPVGLDGIIEWGNGGYRLSLPSLDPANPAFWRHAGPTGRA